jgi:hypothetical protein
MSIESATLKPSAKALYDFNNVRSVDGTHANRPWRIDWTLDDKTTFSAWNTPQHDERAYIADGWGQRDPFNKDAGATLPYIVRRCTGGSIMYFASVFESHPIAEPFVRNVKRIHRGGDKLALEVETADGTDYIESTSRGIRVTSKTGRTLNWEFHNGK